MEQVTWRAFMFRVVGERPPSPEPYRRGSKEYAEAEVYCQAWHDYVGQITALARKPTTEALILFRNIQETSGEWGRQTVMAVGQSLTYKSIEECEDGHLHDGERRQDPLFWTDTTAKVVLGSL